MNTIESHPTGESCEECGSEIVNEYGRVRCSNVTCPTRMEHLINDSNDENAVCDACGASVRKSDNYCGTCGEAVREQCHACMQDL